MPITVNQRPSTLISGNTSRWNAAKNPLLYKFVRKDYNWVNLTAPATGTIQIIFPGLNLTTLSSALGGPVVVGSKIWVKSDDLRYNGQYTVSSISYIGLDTIIYATGTTLGSGAPYGYMNMLQRAQYYLEVQVWNNATTDLIQTMKFAPQSDGTINANLSSVLLNSSSIDNTFDYSTSTVTSDDAGNVINFYIKYKEVWIGHANSQTDDIANKFYSLYAARQIGDLYGGNMAEYVNFENGTPLAKFLNMMTRPVIWRGYPWSISALTSDNQTTNSNFRVEYFDIAGASISSNAPTKVPSLGKCQRFMPQKSLAIPTNAYTAQIRYEKTGVTVLSETITCDIEDPCSNPILLYWRNSLGGDSWWMFEVNQEYGYRYDNNRKAKRYKLFADNLTLNQFEALNELVTLGEVYEPALVELSTSVNKSQARIGSQVYIVDITGKKTGVIVIPNEVVTLTRKKRHKLQITIELPETY